MQSSYARRRASNTTLLRRGELRRRIVSLRGAEADGTLQIVDDNFTVADLPVFRH
jgi:hypothetical protein